MYIHDIVHVRMYIICKFTLYVYTCTCRYIVPCCVFVVRVYVCWLLIALLRVVCFNLSFHVCMYVCLVHVLGDGSDVVWCF